MYPKTERRGPPPKLPFRNPLTNEDEVDEEHEALLELSGSGPDSNPDSAATADTLNTRNRGLRIMSWNLQDLGGGPSRGGQRDATAIEHIATILYECDPDLCVILEVKQRVWLPPAPVRPVAPYRTRNRTQQVVNAEYQRRIDEYPTKLLEWEAERDRRMAAAPRGQSPGALELGRIVERLNRMQGVSPYEFRCSDFTEGEAYGFIFKTQSLTFIESELIAFNHRGERLFWPKPGYRAPAKARFRPKDLVRQQWPNELHVIAFHAPAPNHGEITRQAILKFSQLAWEVNTVVAGDFNMDTETLDQDAGDEALDTLHSFYDGPADFWVSIVGVADGEIGEVRSNQRIALSGRLLGWIRRDRYEIEDVDVGDRGDADEGEEDEGEEDDDAAATDHLVGFDGLFSGVGTTENGQGQRENTNLDRVLMSLSFTNPLLRIIDPPLPDHEEDVIGREHEESLEVFKNSKTRTKSAKVDWSGLDERFSYPVAAESGRTSLRKKVDLAEDEFDREQLKYGDTDAFNNAGYDKLFVVPGTRETIMPFAAHIYPLLERCLPAEMKEEAFSSTQLNEEAIGASWGTISDVERQAMATLARWRRARERRLELLAIQRQAIRAKRQEKELGDDADAGPQEADTLKRSRDWNDQDYDKEENIEEVEVRKEKGEEEEEEEEEDEGDDDDEEDDEDDDDEDEDEAPDEHQLELYDSALPSIRAVRVVLQHTLDRANKISDHVPLILDVRLI